jgi:hypothetical protein
MLRDPVKPLDEVIKETVKMHCENQNIRVTLHNLSQVVGASRILRKTADRKDFKKAAEGLLEHRELHEAIQELSKSLRASPDPFQLHDSRLERLRMELKAIKALEENLDAFLQTQSCIP